MTSDTQPDATWSTLSETEPAARIGEMRQRFEVLADLDEVARGQQVEAMIYAEYALDDDQLITFTESRLRAWMAMAGDNLERTQSVATVYEQAFERVPGAIAMKRATLVQTVARVALTPEDIDVLYELIPKLVVNVPRASQEAMELDLSASRKAEASASNERETGKPWWKVWG